MYSTKKLKTACLPVLLQQTKFIIFLIMKKQKKISTTELVKNFIEQRMQSKKALQKIIGEEALKKAAGEKRTD